LRGSRRGKGHNSTSAPPSRVVTTNAKRLRLRPPSPQPADIPSADILSTDILPADIPSADIPFTDILSTSWIRTLKEEKVNIVKDLL